MPQIRGNEKLLPKIGCFLVVLSFVKPFPCLMVLFSVRLLDSAYNSFMDKKLALQRMTPALAAFNRIMLEAIYNEELTTDSGCDRRSLRVWEVL